MKEKKTLLCRNQQSGLVSMISTKTPFSLPIFPFFVPFLFFFLFTPLFSFSRCLCFFFLSPLCLSFSSHSLCLSADRRASGHSMPLFGLRGLRAVLVGVPVTGVGGSAGWGPRCCCGAVAIRAFFSGFSCACGCALVLRLLVWLAVWLGWHGDGVGWQAAGWYPALLAGENSALACVDFACTLHGPAYS